MKKNETRCRKSKNKKNECHYTWTSKLENNEHNNPQNTRQPVD